MQRCRFLVRGWRTWLGSSPAPSTEGHLQLGRSRRRARKRCSKLWTLLRPACDISMSCLYPWRSLFDVARREPSGSGVSEVHRPPGNRGELSLRRIGTASIGPGLHDAGDTTKAKSAYQDFLTLSGRCGPGYSCPHHRKSGIREAAKARFKINGGGEGWKTGVVQKGCLPGLRRSLKPQGRSPLNGDRRSLS